MLTHGSLFSGIGGFDLGFERVGIHTIWQVELDPYCRQVLERHFPEARRYVDIREIHMAYSRLPRRTPRKPECGVKKSVQGLRSCADDSTSLAWVDIISGGFPCQPVSVAGKRQGSDDARWLWPEMLRVISAVRPRWVVAENVYGLITHEGGALLDTVYSDLEGEGYETLPPIVIPACALGAPHRRDRVWIIAHAERHGGGSWRSERKGQQWKAAPEPARQIVAHRPGPRCNRPKGEEQHIQRQPPLPARSGNGGNVDYAGCGHSEQPMREWSESTEAEGSGPPAEPAGSGWWTTEPDVGRVAHGVPARVDRLRALGNSIVPQIAELIGRTIIEVENG